jgi:hypothetical protein
MGLTVTMHPPPSTSTDSTASTSASATPASDIPLSIQDITAMVLAPPASSSPSSSSTADSDADVAAKLDDPGAALHDASEGNESDQSSGRKKSLTTSQAVALFKELLIRETLSKRSGVDVDEDEDGNDLEPEGSSSAVMEIDKDGDDDDDDDDDMDDDDDIDLFAISTAINKATEGPSSPRLDHVSTHNNQ